MSSAMARLARRGSGWGTTAPRLSGLSGRPMKSGEPGWMALTTNERIEFADFYRDLNWVAPTERVVCTGPITFIGAEQVKNDIARFKAAVSAVGGTVEETFMCAL